MTAAVFTDLQHHDDGEGGTDFSSASRGAAHPWLRYFTRRIAHFVLSLFVLVTAVFALVHAVPGDPVRNALGINASPEVISETRHQLGLDKPLWSQYGDYLHKLVSGQLGNSLISGQPVRQTMTQALPATVELVLCALIAAMAIAIPVGMLVAIASQYGKGKAIHALFATGSGLLSVIPDFLLSVILVFVFAVTLRILPVAGQNVTSSYVLPVIALASGPTALLARIARVESQRVLGEEYMRTARAKRLPARLLYVRHALPNLLTATLTVSGLVVSTLFSSVVLVETVFAWPGVGGALVQSVLAKDFPVIQALALFFGGAILVVNLVVDILISRLDPRTSLKEG